MNGGVGGKPTNRTEEPLVDLVAVVVHSYCQAVVAVTPVEIKQEAGQDQGAVELEVHLIQDQIKKMKQGLIMSMVL